MVLFVVGCGGSGGSLGSDAISQSDAEGFCTPDCQQQIDCGTETDLASCVSGCTADMVGWARADAVETVFECTAALACGADDDPCLLEVQPLAVHDEWETACRANLGTCLEPQDVEALCEVTGSVETDDLGFVRFIAPDIVEEMIDCLDGSACGTQLGCVEAVFANHNIDF